MDELKKPYPKWGKNPAERNVEELYLSIRSRQKVVDELKKPVPKWEKNPEEHKLTSILGTN